jgi:putative permease
MRELAVGWMKAAVGLVVVVATLWLLSHMAGLVKMVVIAAILAYMLDPIACFIESYGATRTIATVVIFMGILLMTTTAAMVLLPLVTDEIWTIRDGVSAGRAADIILRVEATLEAKLGFLGLADLNLAQKLQAYSKQAGNRLFGAFRDIVAIVANLLIIPFIMFFLLKDGRGFIKRLISLVPNRYFEFTLSLIHKTDAQLGGYIRGQFMDSAIVGFLTLLVLLALDVKYFVLLGVVMGLSNLVPFVGPIIGAIPPIAVALIETGDMQKPLYVALAMILVQIVDNGLVKPVVVAKMVSLHPVAVLLAVVIGGKFFGVMGMILSVPVVGITKLTVEEAVVNFRKYRFT